MDSRLRTPVGLICQENFHSAVATIAMILTSASTIAHRCVLR